MPLALGLWVSLGGPAPSGSLGPWMHARVIPESSQGEEQGSVTTIVAGIDVSKVALSVHADGDDASQGRIA